MSVMPTAAAKKLIAHLKSDIEVLHHDPKGFTLVLINAGQKPVLLNGFDEVKGVTLITAPHDSFHYGSNKLVRIKDFPAFLGDAKKLDERSMRWKGGAYAEACRFGRRVMVGEGGNNARNLRTVGLVFDAEADAKRFFESWQRALPRGWVETGPVYVEGEGGISREYLASDAMRKNGVHAAVVRVVDETFSHTKVDPKGTRTEKRKTFATAAEALQALNAFEVDWFKQGGVQHEIEFMKTIKRRSDRTLLEHLQEELDEADDPRAFVTKLLGDAKLTLPADLSDDRDALRRAVWPIHEVHWLRVGERLEKGVEHHEVMNRKGVHVYVDRAHLAVAVVTVDARRSHTFADVKRADAKKFDALVQKTLKKYELI
ncbi:MAG: hypothetical protein U0228_10680 [Myxococcaceae bacterium]